MKRLAAPAPAVLLLQAPPTAAQQIGGMISSNLSRPDTAQPGARGTYEFASCKSLRRHAGARARACADAVDGAGCAGCAPEARP